MTDGLIGGDFFNKVTLRLPQSVVLEFESKYEAEQKYSPPG